MTGFAKLALAALAATYVLIAVGGLVRSTQSGLGCPDWPGCSTEWDVHAWIEYSHRAVAAVVAGLVVTLAVAAFIARQRDRVLAAASVSAAVLVLVQAALGGIVVLLELRSELVTLHLALALSLAGLLVFIADRAVRGPMPSANRHATLGRLVGLAAGLVLAQMLVGSWVALRGAGLAFGDFPLMDGALLPALDSEVEGLHFAHRALAVVVVLAVGSIAVGAFRSTGDRTVRRFALAAALLVALQVALGAANVWSRLAAVFVVPHLVVGALLWGALAALALSTRRVVADPARAGIGRERRAEIGRGWSDTVQAYIGLTKPRIIQLLLVTTVPTMVLAERGLPSPWLVAATLIGGTLAAGSANAVNCYIDRQIDSVMTRTRRRPLPRRAVSPNAALVFGIALGAVALAWLWATVNALSAVLALAAILFYVFVYTLWMKRSTPQNVVIGGAAGCAPVLVAWASVTGTIEVPALVLFAIVFYWTPPHFWALALRYRGDYAAAGVPMLPVVQGEAETARQIVFYSLGLVAVTLLLLPAAEMGVIYLLAASLLGAIFLAHAVRVWRSGGAGRGAIRLFRYSISYLALLFAAIGLDSLVRLPLG